MTLLATILAAIAVHPTEHNHPWRSAVASWYDEHGPGACNLGPDVQTGYRFASLILRCGTRVRFCHNSRCATATMADHGPYITGRTFDLNYQLHDAIDCPGVCTVRWQIV
jgi:hypothetical protein